MKVKLWSQKISCIVMWDLGWFFVALPQSAGLKVALQDGYFPKGLVGAFWFMDVASFPDSDSALKLWASWDLLRHFYCPIPVALKCFRNTYKLKQRHLFFLILGISGADFNFFSPCLCVDEKKTEAKKKCSGKSIYTQTGAQPASTPEPWNSHRGFPITSHFISRAVPGGMSKPRDWRVKTET